MWNRRRGSNVWRVVMLRRAMWLTVLALPLAVAGCGGGTPAPTPRPAEGSETAVVPSPATATPTETPWNPVYGYDPRDIHRGGGGRWRRHPNVGGRHRSACGARFADRVSLHHRFGRTDSVSLSRGSARRVASCGCLRPVLRWSRRIPRLGNPRHVATIAGRQSTAMGTHGVSSRIPILEKRERRGVPLSPLRGQQCESADGFHAGPGR